MFGSPSYRLGGTVMGDRSIEAIGCTYFEDITNNRKAVVTMSTFKKTGWIRNTSEGIKDEVHGVIYEPSKKIKGDAKSIKKHYGKDMD